MGLSGASLNRDVLLRLEELNAVREQRAESISPDMLTEPNRVPIARPLPVTRTIEQILIEAGRTMKRAEVQERVEATFGVSVPRSTVKNALAGLAAASRSSVTRVGRGTYLAN